MSDDLTDQLRKLGLRVRPRTVGSTQPATKKPGQIAFDDRGNAVFEWSNETLANDDSESADRARSKALQYHGLAIVEDEPAKDAPVQVNAKGLRLGYNPYESGLLPKTQRKKKRDLRELSKWVETKRKLASKKDD